MVLTVTASEFTGMKKSLSTYVRDRLSSPASKFEGSNRQLRSRILKLLLKSGPSTAAAVSKSLGAHKASVETNLGNMIAEGLITRTGRRYTVA